MLGDRICTLVKSGGTSDSRSELNSDHLLAFDRNKRALEFAWQGCCEGLHAHDGPAHGLQACGNFNRITCRNGIETPGRQLCEHVVGQSIYLN